MKKKNNYYYNEKRKKKKNLCRKNRIGPLPRFYCENCIAILGLYCNLGGWKVAGAMKDCIARWV